LSATVELQQCETKNTQLSENLNCMIEKVQDTSDELVLVKSQKEQAEAHVGVLSTELQENQIKMETLLQDMEARLQSEEDLRLQSEKQLKLELEAAKILKSRLDDEESAVLLTQSLHATAERDLYSVTCELEQEKDKKCMLEKELMLVKSLKEQLEEELKQQILDKKMLVDSHAKMLDEMLVDLKKQKLEVQTVKDRLDVEVDLRQKAETALRQLEDIFDVTGEEEVD